MQVCAGGAPVFFRRPLLFSQRYFLGLFRPPPIRPKRLSYSLTLRQSSYLDTGSRCCSFPCIAWTSRVTLPRRSPRCISYVLSGCPRSLPPPTPASLTDRAPPFLPNLAMCDSLAIPPASNPVLFRFAGFRETLPRFVPGIFFFPLPPSSFFFLCYVCSRLLPSLPLPLFSEYH